MPDEVANNIRAITSAWSIGVTDPSQMVDRFTRRGLVQDRAIYNREATDNYCGLYVSSAALLLLDRPVAIEEIVDLDFVDHPQGTTAATLVELMNSHAATAELVQGVSVADLARLNGLAILHVGPAPGAEPTHYVLYLGDDDGRALIYDPPGPIQRLSYSELASRFYGTAIAIGDGAVQHDHRLSSLANRRYLQSIGLAALPALAVAIASFGSRRGRGSRRAAGVAALSIASVAVVQARELSPLISRPTAAYQSADFELHSVAEFDQLRSAADTVTLVDARHPATYRRGSPSHAVQLPPGTGQAQRIDALFAHGDWETAVVVFCDGEECPLAGEMARTLKEDGFDNVYIMKFDWRLLGASHGT